MKIAYQMEVFSCSTTDSYFVICLLLKLNVTNHKVIIDAEYGKILDFPPFLLSAASR